MFEIIFEHSGKLFLVITILLFLIREKLYDFSEKNFNKKPRATTGRDCKGYKVLYLLDITITSLLFISILILGINGISFIFYQIEYELKFVDNYMY